MKLFVGLLLLGVALAGFANGSAARQEIQQRIQPVGQVSVQESPVKESLAMTSAPRTEPGQETYNQYCIVCHKDGLAGAPKFRNEQDWKPRLSGRTIDDLVASSIKGLNAMPTKGTCLKCSEEDLKAAITYMLPRS